ncbi:MAG: iron-containing redox enzyme family protein [Verrucomicrobiaceae bacterium]|nr:iron-containing redox enzyme family protein [Verrucomicrobiaceae bacterium]
MTHTKNPTARGPAKARPSITSVLDARIELLLTEIEATVFWKELISPKAKPEFVCAFLREVYLEIVSYQQHVIEAAIASIGQMPRSMPVRMIKALLRHQAEEFDHGEMALRDYVALGGSAEYAQHGHTISTASFSVSAVWWMITKLRDPFAYLGALYPFEGLTPIVSKRVMAILAKKGFPDKAKEYLTFHSTEDEKHAALVKAMIEETVKRYPQAYDSVVNGMERFLAVYPLPVWNAAYKRAKTALGRWSQTTQIPLNPQNQKHTNQTI